MRFRAGRSGTRKGARRPMDWEYALGEFAAMNPSTKSAFQVVTATELNAEYTDPTLMATRMVSAVNWSAGSNVSAVCVIGLIAWDDFNNTVPTAAETPGPITNGNLDWIIRQVHINAGGDATSSEISPGDHTVMAKSRRRLGSSRTLLCVAETNAAALTVGAVADVRCLIKE